MSYDNVAATGGMMAAERHVVQRTMLTVQRDAPLIGVPSSHDDELTVTYYADEAAADAAITEDVVRNALALAGAWADVPWEELEAGLDRIRHESEPTPPFEL
jgi:hypothetical protein